ncbi:hypothetical protein LCGC14_1383880 [marine sediment metagenome]|uniref:Uncharacterized protein n=1 Tax=marine sediment metagenome TaxID=412755 RepID=A0A0F9K243_9ZZZZ
MEFINNDGGRAAAGFQGTTGDCVIRSIVIALELPYQQVYDEMNGLIKSHRKTKIQKSSSSRGGVNKKFYRNFLESRGWKWIACMKIGTGCKVHLKAEELPKGRIIARVSKHLCAVIDGVINDTHDCSRNETRCVYGYFIKA